jgi:hypothetical protein
MNRKSKREIERAVEKLNKGEGPELDISDLSSTFMGTEAGSEPSLDAERLDIGARYTQ